MNTLYYYSTAMLDVVMTNLHFASKKFLNSSFLSNTASLGIGGPKNGTSYDRVTDTLKECYREKTNKQTHTQTDRHTYIEQVYHLMQVDILLQ